mgnify:CR=1 FL=1
MTILRAAARFAGPENQKAALCIGRLPITCHSLRSEAFVVSCSGCELPENVVQDAAVAVVIELVERIDPAQQRHAGALAVAARAGGLLSP